jgi:hypothetical protein
MWETQRNTRSTILSLAARLRGSHVLVIIAVASAAGGVVVHVRVHLVALISVAADGITMLRLRGGRFSLRGEAVCGIGDLGVVERWLELVERILFCRQEVMRRMKMGRIMRMMR